MKAHSLILLTALGLAACEQTPEQHTASAEKSAKNTAEQGHTETQALGELLAAEAWARETPENATTGGAYLTIVNGTHNGDTLVSANANFAKSTQIHRSTEVDGVARMEPIPNGLPIPSGATLKLEPGGMHIMFTGLTEPLKAGDVKVMTLTFKQAGEKQIPVIVRALTDEGPVPAGEDHGSDHGDMEHEAQ